MKNSSKGWSILNLLAFIAVMVVNTLAITLPINGMDTGKISDRYPNLFVPAGFTFSIWSVIYLLLLCFSVYGLKLAFSRNNRPETIGTLLAIAPLFFASCLLNITWIMLWHYLQIGLSVVVMLLFLLTLIAIFLRLRPFVRIMNRTEIFFIGLPFSVYFGWISIATVANITALLVHLGWNGFGIAASSWSAAMILVATLLGIIFLYKWKELAYAGVITWALFGIYSKQMGGSPLVGYTALSGMVILLIGMAVTIIKSIQTAKAST